MASKRCSWKPASASTWTKPRTPTTTRRQRACRGSSAGCWRRRCRGDAAVATAAASGWPGLNLQCCQVAFFLEPRLAVPGTLPGQQHVHQRTRLVGVVDRQLHQPAGVGMDGRLAQLRRIHLAKALEPGHVDRAGHALRSEEHTSELQSLMRISYAV